MRIEWETVYTIVTLLAIIIGCYACFVPDYDRFGYLMIAGAVYFAGILISYFVWFNNKYIQKDSENEMY